VFLEGDFVVASPEFGLLAVEVNGGRVELRDGRWFQNGAPMKKPPLRPALDFVHALARWLRTRGVAVPPFGAVAVFPDCEFSTGPGAGDLDGVVLGAQDTPYIADAIVAAAKRAVPERPPPPLGSWGPAIGRLRVSSGCQRSRRHARAPRARSSVSFVSTRHNLLWSARQRSRRAPLSPGRRVASPA
jgi:hypothetical protein